MDLTKRYHDFAIKRVFRPMALSDLCHQPLPSVVDDGERSFLPPESLWSETLLVLWRYWNVFKILGDTDPDSRINMVPISYRKKGSP